MGDSLGGGHKAGTPVLRAGLGTRREPDTLSAIPCEALTPPQEALLFLPFHRSRVQPGRCFRHLQSRSL